MRLIDLEIEGDPLVELVLHPRITVVAGERSALDRITQHLARAFDLAGAEVRGSVEYSGFTTPLDPTTVVSLDLPGHGLPVLRPGDVPAPDDRARTAALDALRRRGDGFVEDLERIETELLELERRSAATAAAVEVGREELAAATASLEELQNRTAEVEARLAELAAETSAAEEAIGSTEERLRRAEEVAPGLLEVFAHPTGRVCTLRSGDSTEAERALLGDAAVADLLPAEQIEELRAWCDAVQRGDVAPDPVVAELLEEVAELEQRWATLVELGVEGEPAVVEARERHEALGNRLADLQELAASGILVDRARAEIEAAHERRAELESERRVRRRELDDAVAAEHAVAARYGFDNYYDYTIALSTRSVGEALASTLDKVRAEAIAASDALDAMRDAAAAERDAVAAERDELRERLRVRTGGDLDLDPAVLERIPALPAALEHMPDAVASALQELRRSLDGCRDALRVGSSARAEVEAELAELVVEATATDGRLGQLAPLVDRADVANDEALAAVLGAREACAERRAALAELEGELQRLSVPVTEYTPTDIPAVVAALAPVVDRGHDTVPVALADTFAPLGDLAVPALETLMVSAVRTQLVYLCPDGAVLEWAQDLGSGEGSFVDLRPRGWFRRRFARHGRGAVPRS